MKNTIAQIIGTIPSGCFFDSHYVISMIIERGSDVYIHFAGPEETTAQMHGRIAVLVSTLPDLCRPTGNQSWSHNIHHTPGVCALWERI